MPCTLLLSYCIRRSTLIHRHSYKRPGSLRPPILQLLLLPSQVSKNVLCQWCRPRQLLRGLVRPLYSPFAILRARLSTSYKGLLLPRTTVFYKGIRLSLRFFREGWLPRLSRRAIFLCPKSRRTILLLCECCFQEFLRGVQCVPRFLSVRPPSDSLRDNRGSCVSTRPILFYHPPSSIRPIYELSRARREGCDHLPCVQYSYHL